MYVSRLSEDIREFRVARPEARRRAWLTVFVFNHARRWKLLACHPIRDLNSRSLLVTFFDKKRIDGRTISRVIADTRETVRTSILD